MNLRFPIPLLAAVLGLSCADRISDLSTSSSLAPAIGQCIEVKHPILVFQEKDTEGTELLFVVPAGGIVTRRGGQPFPAGSRFRIDRMIAIEAFEGNYFFIEGNLLDRPQGAKVDLSPLVDFEWVSVSVSRIEAGEQPVLPPSGKVPLNSRSARDCDPPEASPEG